MSRYFGHESPDRMKESAVMPEGAELAISRDQLRQILVGRTVSSVHAVGGRYAKVPPAGMDDFMRSMRVNGVNNAQVHSVNVKGKFMHWRFTNDWVLWCTYGMSGGWETRRDPKHCALELYHRHPSGLVLEDRVPGLYFNDQRHFGTLRFIYDPTSDLTEKKLSTLGPDMLNDPPTLGEFRERLRKRSESTLAETLMDQSVMSGVGNYVKAEALYVARLSPHRIVNGLSQSETRALHEAVQAVLQRAYKAGGATIATYRQPDGSMGDAQRRFAVYGQSEDPLGNPVTNETTKDGRTTWWVRQVQA